MHMHLSNSLKCNEEKIQRLQYVDLLPPTKKSKPHHFRTPNHITSNITAIVLAKEDLVFWNPGTPRITTGFHTTIVVPNSSKFHTETILHEVKNRCQSHRLQVKATYWRVIVTILMYTKTVYNMYAWITPSSILVFPGKLTPTTKTKTTVEEILHHLGWLKTL